MHLNKDFKFQAWEGIKTEQSYKFNQEKINLMAKNNGFKTSQTCPNFDSKYSALSENFESSVANSRLRQNSEIYGLSGGSDE